MRGSRDAWLSTPDLHLQTLFVLDGNGRITSTREPGATRGPLFCLVRDATRCTWAIRADLPDDVARELDALARDEPPVADLRDAPVHADQYQSVLGGRGRVESGPAFAFPDRLTAPANVPLIEDEARLQRLARRRAQARAHGVRERLEPCRLTRPAAPRTTNGR